MFFLLLACFTVLFLYAVYPFLQLLARQLRSPLRHLPGPPSDSFFMGNLREMHDQENNNLIHRWVQQYGTTFVYRGFVGGCRLMTVDPVAVGYILRHAYHYPKPDFVRDSLASMAAGYDGLLTTEGDMHRKQRRILTPAFSTSHVKSLTPIFFQKAELLRDIWLNNPTPKPVDVLQWLGRATLDVIGVAGFGYHFNALENSDSDQLANAFAVIFSTARKFRVMTILQVWFPILRRFRRNTTVMHEARETMKRIGTQLIDAKSQCIHANLKGSPEEAIPGKDILSVLVRSSLLSEPNRRMSQSEILSQISTFLVAGYETTSSALTWTLFALATEQLSSSINSVQTRLRQELRKALDSNDGNFDSRLRIIETLPLLDAVVRETLRVHAPVTNTMRVCTRDEDWVPVQTSNQGIHLRKHDIISIPIQAINKSIDIWGEDAEIWRPGRHFDKPPGQKIPSLYANTLTFLNGNGNNLDGNRSCIGWKFALLEVKVFLAVLLKDLEFTIDPLLVVEKKVNVVTRPFVKSQPELGNQMPLFVAIVPPSDLALNSTILPPSEKKTTCARSSAIKPTVAAKPSRLQPSSLHTTMSSTKILDFHHPSSPPILVQS